MKKKLSIYLAGSIKKDHEKEQSYYWTENERTFLKEALSQYTLSFLNPALRSDNLSDQKSVFGRDMLQVYLSDAVLVDARERRGLGVGAEMMWAKIQQIPVITYAPQNSHYRKERTTLLGVAVQNWVHPFVESLSDAVVSSLDEAALVISSIKEGTFAYKKGIEEIFSAMRHYHQSYFEQDFPMKELIAANEILNQKIQENLCPSLSKN